ncbi:MAG: malate dehydrogenase [Bacteroidales bacterium]
MKALTNEKLLIVGAAGMIGSNMLQTAIMMGLSSNICAYDPYAPALEGAVEEMYHCGFDGVDLTWTTDPKIAFEGAKYIVSSGGAARKAGMTREDLLKGNAEIAVELGKNIKQYCPDAKHVTIVFNPADITGLITLLYSGLKPSQVSTLAALDSTRLRTALAQYFNVPQDKVTGCRTYGGHGEQMAVFASTTKIDGRALSSIIGTEELSEQAWEDMQKYVTQGGKRIIDLRGRSSFQSPSYLSIAMLRAAMGGESFPWPSGTYVNNKDFSHIMMAMETKIDKDGVTFSEVKGTKKEMEALHHSYEHLCKLRNEVIDMGIIPPVEEWKKINPYL